ncbi:hypothetical protein O3S80_42430 [Streptomyces sp. Lzd4kr]|nr:hypothetical protein [Streptomyces sp. Lzd4kr]
MARSARKHADPAKPLRKAPVQIGTLDAAALIGELRHLHETAEDPDVERMPADDELFTALLYLESHAGALKTEEARHTAALHRVKLWEYLREQTDLHQSRAIADARSAGVPWARLAPALAVNAPSAAYNKAIRTRAAIFRDRADTTHDRRPLRRTPEAVLAAERQASQQAAAEERAQLEAARRHRIVAPVAQRLLDHRADLDGSSDVSDWLDEIAAVLPDCQTPTQLVSLEIYMKAVVRALRKTERTTTRPVATSPDAQLAYVAAAELVE